MTISMSDSPGARNSRQHEIIPMESRGTTSIPVSALMIGDNIEVFPEVEAKGLFHLHFAGRELQLVAGPYIGLIPINPRVTIDVRPRLPVANLARVIDRSEQPIAVLQGVERPYKDSTESTSSILEFLSENLVQSLRPILLSGMLKNYSRTRRNRTEPRGKIDVHATLCRNYSRGSRHLVYSVYYESNVDNRHNQVIKAALWYSAARLRRAAVRNRTLISQLNSRLQRFERVSEPVSEEILYRVRDDVWKQRLPASRRYYERPLKIALTILLRGSISLLEHGRDVELSSFIINFEELFEAYIRQVLREEAAIHAEEISVQDGNKEGGKALYDDVGEPRAQPDIVLSSSDRQSIVVVEVKYKRSINRADVNQALVYGISYRANAVALVYPETRVDRFGLRYRGKLGNVVLFSYGFDLGNADLTYVEDAICKTLFSLVAHTEHRV